MLTRLTCYLDSLRTCLRLDSKIKKDVLKELYTHLEDKSQELKESGLSEEEAIETAVKHFGSVQSIARQTYEVYSSGTWRQAFFAALPHLIIALLFALRAWQSIFWLTIILLTVISVVLYGWWHGKPVWLFPWLGYYLIPVIVTGILLVYLPGGWFWLAVLVYLPLALFVLISVTKQTITQDWLYASVMLLPIPIILGWALALGMSKDFLSIERQLHETKGLVALSFLILAITVAIFIRVKQRWLKAGALLTPELLVLVIVAVASRGAISFWLWLGLVILSIFLIFSPAWLERRLTQNHQ